MKRSERHHLKENPLATFLAELSETNWVSTRAVTGGAVVVGALVIAGAVFGWQQYRSSRASALLASAMAVVDAPVAATDATDSANGPESSTVSGTPNEFPSIAAKLETAVPQLLEAAEAYPSLSQGIAARYQAAVALSVLGRTEEADTQYRQVIELDGDGTYARMARLGRAEALLATGDYDGAIALLAEASAASATDDAGLPRDALLMRLGQMYALAGQTAEAASTFRQLIDEFPASGYRFEAQRELNTLPQPGDG